MTLCDAGYRLGASWGRDDVIVFSSDAAPGLMQVSASGGAPESITTLENDESDHRWADILPGGKAVLFTLWSGNFENARIAIQSLDTGERQTLVDGSHPRYAPTGHIVFARANSLWAVPFDSDRLEVTGELTPVLEEVQVNTGGGLANFALAGDGSLVYVPGEVSFDEARRELVRVDRDGNAAPLTETLGDWESPRFSPDGGRLAVRKLDETGQQVWLLEAFPRDLDQVDLRGRSSPSLVTRR